MRELRLWFTFAVAVLSVLCLDVSSGGCVWFDQCGNSPNSTLKTLNCKYDGEPGKVEIQSNKLQSKQISCLAWHNCGTSFGGKYFENNKGKSIKRSFIKVQATTGLADEFSKNPTILEEK